MTYLWRGKLYDTQREVAEAAGRKVATISYHLGRYGNLDNLGNGHTDTSPRTTCREIDYTREAIITLMRRGGWPQDAIAAHFGISQQRVSAIMARAQA